MVGFFFFSCGSDKSWNGILQMAKKHSYDVNEVVSDKYKTPYKR